MRAGLGAGMDLLVHGAAGGIGGAALMIGKALEARPIAVVSSEDKVWYVQELGASDVIVHTRDDFVARTKELTGGKGADRILDVMGGETLARSIDAAARGAHIVCVGALLSEPSAIPSGKLIGKWLTVSGSTLRPQPPQVKAAIAARLKAEIWPALEDGRIARPRIRAVPLELAANAHIEMEKRSNYGKLILLTAFGQSLVNAPPIPGTPDIPIESV
jgi:NADPH:quinone reductase